MVPMLRAAFRVAAGCLVGALAAGCGTSRDDDPTLPMSCGQLLSSTIAQLRAGQTGNGHDLLSFNIERLRTSGCSQQWDVFADYSSGRGVAEQLGPRRCSELAGHNVERAAIQLLREDDLCRGRVGAAHPPQPSLGGAQPDAEISWSEARDLVGTDQRVCGPLAGTGRSQDDYFLNLGRDYPDPERFTIVLWDVGGVEPIPEGATLCASGLITSYEGVAQLELRSASAVEVNK
jgi:hypothetical protein